MSPSWQSRNAPFCPILPGGQCTGTRGGCYGAAGRILASVPELPGVMACGGDEKEAVRKVKTIALQVLADMIESGEKVPEPLKVLFAA